MVGAVCFDFPVSLVAWGALMRFRFRVLENRHQNPKQLTCMDAQ